MPPNRFTISRDSPAYYLTAVAKDRLPVFRTDEIALLACRAIDEVRQSGKFMIFAYIIMPDHFHLVTDSRIESTEVHRFVNGIISRRVIDHLKETGRHVSLEKLRVRSKADGTQYSLWQHRPNARLLWSEQMLWQRIQYTHLNPVRAGLADHPNDWRWSSARIFHGRRRDDEPLEVDLGKVAWRGN